MTKKATDSKQRVVVIGNGMAGARLIEELLASGGTRSFDIVVFGDEPCDSYNRIRLSGLIAGTDSAEDIMSHPASWYEQHGITLHRGVRAGWIDRIARKVYAPGGLTEYYDKLILATGSVPVVPPLDGLNDESGSLRAGVFTFRTLADCQGMERYIVAGRKAAVIGGGLLGLEAAAGLFKRGMEVQVVHAAPFLMETQLDSVAGSMLKGLLETMGFRIHLDQSAKTITSNGQSKALVLKDGSTLECDLVVITTGTRPSTDLAKQAGLSVQRGIVVNSDLSCRNDPNVFAIGDCAEYRGQVYGTIAPAWEQARVLAKRLTGNDKAFYHGSGVSSSLKINGVELTVMGKTAGLPGDEVVNYLEASRCIYKKLIIRERKLGGAIFLGDAAAAARVLQVFHNQEPLPDDRAEILFPATGGSPYMSVADMPDTTRICNCNGVSKGEIVAAVMNGSRTMRSLCEATRAGTGCGSCKPQIQAILELASGGVAEDDPSADYYVPGVPLAKPELVRAIREQNLRSVSAVFNALAGGKEDAGSKMGLASLLKTIWGKDYLDERDARFINDRIHANIQKDGTFSVVPRIYGGIVSAAKLGRIAEAAGKYGASMIKITGGQRIALLGIPKETLPEVWKDLDMPSGHAYTKAFRTCKTCVGSDFCRYGLGDSATLGTKIESRFQGVETPHKIKLAVSGCPRNCAEATTKDLGATAIGEGKWEVCIGGAAGSRVRRGDVLCIVDSPDDVLKYMGRFIGYYREQAKYQERTYDFVERIGVERLRQLLVDDAEGICEQLDKTIQTAVEAYADPWKEAERPVHIAQFATAIGVINE